MVQTAVRKQSSHKKRKCKKGGIETVALRTLPCLLMRPLGVHASSDDVEASGRTLGCTGKAAAASDAVEKREEGDAVATVTAGENMVASKRPAVVDGPTCLPCLARRASRVMIPSRRAACAEDSGVYGTATAVVPLKSHTITFDLLLLRHERETGGRWGDTVCFGGACGVGSRRRRNKGAERAVRTIVFYVCTTGWSCKMFARLAGIYFSYQTKLSPHGDVNTQLEIYLRYKTDIEIL